MRIAWPLLLIAGLLAACGSPAPAPTSDGPVAAETPAEAPTAAAPGTMLVTATGAAVEPLVLHSLAFGEGEAIPVVHTCDGDDTSPPMSWEHVPKGTVSLSLIMNDPDAGGWVHWAVFNLPAEADGLPGGIAPGPQVQAGGRHGSNTWGELAYGGPCPPAGRHRYVFTLYALDSSIDLDPGATREQILQAAEGHILASAETTGTYQRP